MAIASTMETGKEKTTTERRARQVLADINFCLSKVAGTYAAYPNVDAAVFRRMHAALGEGLVRRDKGSTLGDFCQELRAVMSCPVAELLRFAGADDTDTRLAAIAQVLRERARLEEDVFRELLTGLLSWERKDKAAILEAVTAIVRT